MNAGGTLAEIQNYDTQREFIQYAVKKHISSGLLVSFIALTHFEFDDPCIKHYVRK